MRGKQIVTLLAPFALMALSGCCAASRESLYCSDHALRPLNSVPIATVPVGQPLPCLPVSPAPAPAPPPEGTPVPGATAPLASAPMPTGPIQQVWGQPAKPQTTLGLPEPAAGQPRQSATLETPEPPLSPAKPEPKEEPAATPVMPLGIAGFAPVKEGVSTGRRPILDGLDWLKKREYRTVLHLRRPGVNDDTDRKEFETRRGIKYLTLEVPDRLTQEFVDRFNQIVNDPERRPLFVYDEKGQLSGALWSLYFRTSENLSDEDARKKANALGFKEDDPANRDLWLAIQQFLNDREPKP
jgi:DSP-PTPase phosphatase fused to NAD+ Kinase